MQNCPMGAEMFHLDGRMDKQTGPAISRTRLKTEQNPILAEYLTFVLTF
jgi:hypothetical protein